MASLLIGTSESWNYGYSAGGFITSARTLLDRYFAIDKATDARLGDYASLKADYTTSLAEKKSAAASVASSAATAVGSSWVLKLVVLLVVVGLVRRLNFDWEKPRARKKGFPFSLKNARARS